MDLGAAPDSGSQYRASKTIPPNCIVVVPRRHPPTNLKTEKNKQQKDDEKAKEMEQARRSRSMLSAESIPKYLVDQWPLPAGVTISQRTWMMRCQTFKSDFQKAVLIKGRNSDGFHKKTPPKAISFRLVTCRRGSGKTLLVSLGVVGQILLLFSETQGKPCGELQPRAGRESLRDPEESVSLAAIPIASCPDGKYVGAGCHKEQKGTKKSKRQ